MNCNEIESKLAAFYDGELKSKEREIVASHLAECPHCATIVDQFRQLTEQIADASPPGPPDDLWNRIESRLTLESTRIAATHGSDSTSTATDSAQINVSPKDKVVRKTHDLASGSEQPSVADQGQVSDVPTRHRSVTGWAIAIAATILIATTIPWWAQTLRDTLRHTGDPQDSIASNDSADAVHRAELAQTMEAYVQAMSQDVEMAEQFLLTKYDGRRVDPEQAVSLVGYRPAVASGLPESYTLASTSVVKMPCCTCVQAICRRADGSALVLFEHDDAANDWFGGHPQSMATCGDKECCLVNLDPAVAATWKRGSRWVTAIGVRDQSEVGKLVQWFDSQMSDQSSHESRIDHSHSVGHTVHAT